MGQLYDAVWSIALGLNATEERLGQINSSLKDFNYRNIQIRKIFMQELDKLSFYGTTVSMQIMEIMLFLNKIDLLFTKLLRHI